MSTATNENKLRHHAEQQFAEELEELKKSDARQRPANWELSPWAVCTYLLGGELDNGFTVSAKYIGNRRIIETAVATLATDRALLLYGVPGTAKSWAAFGIRRVCRNRLPRYVWMPRDCSANIMQGTIFRKPPVCSRSDILSFRCCSFMANRTTS